MNSIKWFLLWGLVAGALLQSCSACSSHDDPTDASVRDGDGDPGDKLDGGGDSLDGDENLDGDGDEDSTGDIDLGDNFGILVPKDSRGCAAGRSVSALDGYKMRAQIKFKPGLIKLPRDRASFSAVLAEQLFFGPTRLEAAATTDGLFTRTIEQFGDSVLFVYAFQQPFSAGGQPLTLQFSVAFAEKAGVPVAPLLTLDEATLEQNLFLSIAADQAIEYFNSCVYSGFYPIQHEIETQNGDLLKLTQLWLDDDRCMLACEWTLTAATFTRGTEERQVDDFFRLAHADGQHNWHQEFLVGLEPPVGTVHAVYIKDGETDLLYLDQSLNVSDRSKIVRHDTSK